MPHVSRQIFESPPGAIHLIARLVDRQRSFNPNTTPRLFSRGGTHADGVIDLTMTGDAALGKRTTEQRESNATQRTPAQSFRHQQAAGDQRSHPLRFTDIRAVMCSHC